MHQMNHVGSWLIKKHPEGVNPSNFDLMEIGVKCGMKQSMKQGTKQALEAEAGRIETRLFQSRH
jgi:hypothetical protein